MKRVIYYTNAILGSLTIAGFVTIYVGLLGMIVVGGLHVISLLYYFMVWKTLSPRGKQGILYYCVVLGGIALLALLGEVSNNEALGVTAFILCALAGIYFTVVINWIHKDAAREITTNESFEGILDSGLE